MIHLAEYVGQDPILLFRKALLMEVDEHTVKVQLEATESERIIASKLVDDQTLDGIDAAIAEAVKFRLPERANRLRRFRLALGWHEFDRGDWLIIARGGYKDA